MTLYHQILYQLTVERLPHVYHRFVANPPHSSNRIFFSVIYRICETQVNYTQITTCLTISNWKKILNISLIRWGFFFYCNKKYIKSKYWSLSRFGHTPFFYSHTVATNFSFIDRDSASSVGSFCVRVAWFWSQAFFDICFQVVLWW